MDKTMIKKDIKKKLKIIIKKFYKPLIRIQMSRLNLMLFDQFTSDEVFSNKESFFTYHLRPKKNIYKVEEFKQKKVKNNRIGIVIQGGIKYEDDFTLETAKYYKKILPDAKIVVSTWKDEKEEIIIKFKKEGIDIILNEKPSIRGFGNNNLQIFSTKKGIEKLDEYGVEYILKTRTDQRIYYEGFIDYFLNLINEFPINDKTLNQIKRVVVLNIGTCIDIPFLITDMMQFGHIDDMKKMWYIPLQKRDVNLNNFWKDDVNSHDLFNIGASELYIIKNFLLNVNGDIQYTYNNHLNILKNRFLVVDKSNIDLFWYKYEAKEYPNIDYTKAKSFKRFNFCDWFNLYCSTGEIYDIDERKIEEVIK